MFRSRCGGAGDVESSGPRRRRRGLLVVTAAAGLLAAACGGGSGADGEDASSDAASRGAGTPKAGGTLSFAEYTTPLGLDPLVSTGSGSTGLIEMTAVYDTLLRYDYQTKQYKPGTAESVTSNADATEWTIKLRPGITFTDGTPYDADAVAFGIDRQRSGAPGAPPCEQLVACPRNTQATSFVAADITAVTAVDPLTVTVAFARPMGPFPVALASEGGLIPSPTALKKCAAGAPPNQCAFNTAPVGAGPFMVTSFKPGEAVTMVRNPDYWGGQVYLDGLRFVDYRDGGGLKTLDALKAGQVQAAMMRDPAGVAGAHDAGFEGWSDLQFGGGVLLLNVGTPTAPTHDLTVRKAIAAAVDPQVANERGYDGKARATSQLFSPKFAWYPDVPGPAYDPAEARKLVGEAKAAGWDGRIRVLTSNAPSATNVGLAVQAMLQNAGMTVELDSSKDAAAVAAATVKHDFDIALNGMSVGNDDYAQIALAKEFSSTASANRVGVADPALDRGFADLFAATDDAQKTAAYRRIATAMTTGVPILPIATFEQHLPWSGQVHGIQPQVKASVYLDKAWLG